MINHKKLLTAYDISFKIMQECDSSNVKDLHNILRELVVAEMEGCSSLTIATPRKEPNVINNGDYKEGYTFGTGVNLL